MDDLLQSHKDLKGVFGINDDSALGAFDRDRRRGDERQDRRHRLRCDARSAHRDQGGRDVRRCDPASRPDRLARRSTRSTTTSAGRRFRREIAVPVGTYTQSQRAVALPDASAPLLRMLGITKSFPGVRALDGVTFDVRAGEVHALVGENGAGKSTLMKILAGAQRADAGTIEIDGRAAAIDGPRDAEALGIGMIYQEFNLVPDLGVVENIVLGREPRRGVFLDRAEALRRDDGGTDGAWHRAAARPQGPRSFGRAAADGRDLQGAVAQGALDRDGRADGRADRSRDRAHCSL